VVENLTRNAVARADRVTLSAQLEDGQARVDVADNGPGFDPGIIDYVFERFRRGDRAGSAGLGMAIARTIVELHDGRCEARNLDEGGALVSFWLPLRVR
jgi:signal transduction histidine kinase